MGRPTKYKRKFAKELMEGIRRTPYVCPYSGKEYGWSIERLCHKWGITERTYQNWRNEYKSFDEAAEHGDRDFRIYWLEKIEDGVNAGKNANGALLKFVATNVLGWSDKKEVKHEGQQKIGTVNISMLDAPKREDVKQIEDNVIDVTEYKSKSDKGSN